MSCERIKPGPMQESHIDTDLDIKVAHALSVQSTFYNSTILQFNMIKGFSKII